MATPHSRPGLSSIANSSISSWCLPGLALPIILCLVVACTDEPDTGADPYGRTRYEIDIPYRFPELTISPENPLTVEGVALGRRLFYDPVLSGDNTQSCATCHQQANAFTDPQQFSTGIDGMAGDRNAMPIINAAWMPRQFWDGRVASLEQQAFEPVQNPIEMHESWPDAILELVRDPVYPALFEKAFGTDEINPLLVTYAIAQFERTLISADSRYDHFLQGKVEFTEQELNGRVLFFTERGDCFHCHGGILFTDNDFHNNGLDTVPPDPGLGAISGDRYDRGKFKTPTLRNIALTAPYMHDGRFATLKEVVDFYSESVKPSETVDVLMKNVHQGGVRLTEAEKLDLIAFLETLTDTNFTTNPDYQSPF